MKPIIHSNFNFKLDYDFKKSIEIWIDNFENVLGSTSEVKIFIAMEPNVISKINNYIKDNYYLFTYILTFDEDLLKNVPNALLFEFGTKWIDIDNYKFGEKKFEVSFVCGSKMIAPGHLLRQKIWYNQDKISVPTNFFINQFGGPQNINNNKILGDLKTPLFDSMFHICVENNSNNYYFSEKLIDCLLCKSIPIYFGCKNTCDYFNADGIFVFNNWKECIEVCNKLTEEDYTKRLNIVEENYLKALSWIDYPERLKNKIEEII